MSGQRQWNRTTICHLVCALLMAMLLVLQFTPFWQYGEAEETASIGAYVWFPGNHAALDNHLKETVGGDYSINQVVGPAVLMLLLSAAGTVVCLIKPKLTFVSLLPIACGVAGTWGYLSTPALRLGMNWSLHLGLSIALMLLGALALYWGVMEQKAVAPGHTVAA